MRNKLVMVFLMSLLGCSSLQEYEADTFPTGKWYPVNKEIVK